MNKRNFFKMLVFFSCCLVLASWAADEESGHVVGKFAPIPGDKCDPSCEGTYTINGKSENGLLILVNTKTAEVYAPYQTKDLVTLEEIRVQKPMTIGSWKKSDDGGITIIEK